MQKWHSNAVFLGPLLLHFIGLSVLKLLEIMNNLVCASQFTHIFNGKFFLDRYFFSKSWNVNTISYHRTFSLFYVYKNVSVMRSWRLFRELRNHACVWLGFLCKPAPGMQLAPVKVGKFILNR